MTIKFIDTNSTSEIKKNLKNIKYSHYPLVIKNGFSLFNLDEWVDFLTNECGFKLDNRHHNYLTHKIENYIWWEISYQEDKSISFAFSKTPQPLHNDNAWFKDGADFNFNVMIKQAPRGGELTYYSVKKIVEDLKKIKPELFKQLTTIPVEISKGNEEFHHTTILSEYQDGYRIFWNYFRTKKDDLNVKKMVDDFFNFLKEQESNGAVNSSRFETGDCFVWNDRLLVHGRKSFEASKPYDKVIKQCMGYFNEQ